jgi:hypothetical protein
MQEQFIRQAQYIPSQPVVVIASSNTPNWKESSCDSVSSAPSALSSKEEVLLASRNSSDGISRIVTKVNEDLFKDWGRNVLKLLAKYQAAGVQLWRHDQ